MSFVRSVEAGVMIFLALFPYQRLIARVFLCYLVQFFVSSFRLVVLSTSAASWVHVAHFCVVDTGIKMRFKYQGYEV